MQSVVLTSVHPASPLFGSVASAGDTWEVDDATDGAHDIDITADGLFTIDYTGTDREIFSHNLFDASASSYVGVGYVFINGPHGVVLESVDALSPLAGSVAVAGDYWEVSDQTDGGHDVNIFADGLFSIDYGGTDREIFTHDLFDHSAAAFVGAGEVVVNNKAPNFGQPATFPRSFSFKHNEAIVPVIDLELSYAPDPEGDDVTVVELEPLPAGVSIVANILQGTPTKYVAPAGYAIRWTDEYGDSYVEDMILGVAPAGRSSIRKVIKDVDVTRPNQLAPTVQQISQTQNNIFWLAATDPQGHPNEAVSGIAGYRVYRDGVLRSDQAGTSYNDTGLSPWTNYTYTVEAYDAAGNVSVLSTPSTVRTLDQTPPTAPVIGIIFPTTPSSIQVALTLVSTDAHSGMSHYQLEIRVTGVQNWTIQDTSLQPANFPRTITGLTQNTDYDMRCAAVDIAGNSTYSAIKTARTETVITTGPPVWTSVPTITFTQNSTPQTISIASYVTDPDTPPSGIVITKNALAFHGSSGITYNSAAKQFEYNGTGAVGGTNGHILTADDGVIANQPPVWQASANQSLTQNVFFTLSLDSLCADPESLPLTYSILPGGTLPPGITQTGVRGQTISGTPTSTTGSPFTVTFRATD